jgi:hypothetical protein
MKSWCLPLESAERMKSADEKLCRDREDLVGGLSVTSATLIRRDKSWQMENCVHHREDQVDGHNFCVCCSDLQRGSSRQIENYVYRSNPQRGSSRQMENCVCCSNLQRGSIRQIEN